MSENKNKAVVILSGGMDSTVLLHQLLAADYEVFPLGVNYGQRHARELAFARATCERLGLDYHVADMPELADLFAVSSQTAAAVPVPEGHYAAENMKITVVAHRNLLMISLAAVYAGRIGAGVVAYGAHAGDHAIYPDCRAAFVEPLCEVLAASDWQPLKLIAPFLHKTKADIATLGATLGVDFAATWSCYQGREAHCGKCGTCVERREAFELAGVPDPTIYETEALITL